MKNDPLFVFSAAGSKKSVLVWGQYLSAFERSHLAPSQNTFDLLDSKVPWAKCQPMKIQDVGSFLLTHPFFDNSNIDVSRMATPKPISYTIFWKNPIRSPRYTFLPNYD